MGQSQTIFKDKILMECCNYQPHKDQTGPIYNWSYLKNKINDENIVEISKCRPQDQASILEILYMVEKQSDISDIFNKHKYWVFWHLCPQLTIINDNLDINPNEMSDLIIDLPQYQRKTTLI